MVRIIELIVVWKFKYVNRHYRNIKTINIIGTKIF